MNIEEVAEKTPEKITTVTLDPTLGLQPYQCRKLAAALEDERELATRVEKLKSELNNLENQLAGMLANSSRLTTGRTRPRESPKIEQGFYGPWHEGRWLIGVPAYNSFPSGHTATAFGFAAVIVFASPVLGTVVAIPLAAAVAWASIGIGAHHPSDVIVSILLSCLVAWGVWRFAESRFLLRADS